MTREDSNDSETASQIPPDASRDHDDVTNENSASPAGQDKMAEKDSPDEAPNAENSIHAQQNSDSGKEIEEVTETIPGKDTEEKTEQNETGDQQTQGDSAEVGQAEKATDAQNAGNSQVAMEADAMLSQEPEAVADHVTGSDVTTAEQPMAAEVRTDSKSPTHLLKFPLEARSSFPNNSSDTNLGGIGQRSVHRSCDAASPNSNSMHQCFALETPNCLVLSLGH